MAGWRTRPRNCADGPTTNWTGRTSPRRSRAWGGARSERFEAASNGSSSIFSKWQFQPGRRSESWRTTISEQRTFIEGLLKDSPSLRKFPVEILADTYGAGRQEAIDETGMLASAFPTECPYSLEQVLDRRFLPGKPIEDWAVLRD